VIDDLEMGITHVIRGEDHLANAAKHIALFRAFGAEPPNYAHIPLILNPDGTKMSKRDKGASLSTYMEEGYAPEAVVNYLCLLGWSPKHNREKVTIQEVIQLFDLPQVLRHNARFDINKLHWLDGEYIRQMSEERFRDLGVQALNRAGYDIKKYPVAYVTAALDTCKGKIKRFGELSAYAGFYFREEVDFDPELAAQEISPEMRVPLLKLKDALPQMGEFSAAAIEPLFKALASELGFKTSALVHPVRLACTGRAAGPSLYHLLEVLGKDRVNQRINHFLTRR
jgi:glutamyl/glutaminyl-tRNA synthetase